MLAAEDLAALRDCFAGPLAFGTAGLRGQLGAGPNRMNRAVVLRTAAALAGYLADSGGHSVVIGYDARHNSAVFARDTAAVLAGAGLQARVLPRALPTPVLAFAVRAFAADAGVMVTASHNPRGDNGYKVYLASGSQLTAPVDAEISARSAKVGTLASIPLSTEWEVLDEQVVQAYIDRAASLVAPMSPRDLRISYTPLHGVGRNVLLAVLARAGFPAPQVVAWQGDPDPDFPTTPVPNPEEPGVLDLLLGLAREQGADLALAHDPDADRLAVACQGRVLHGDEVGALLAVHLLRRHPRATGTFAASTVSAGLLARLAEAHGVPYAETLTGFKWIAAVPGLRYGYEEALGYCVDPTAVRDKDGITAAVLVAELAAALKAEGRTLLDLLDDIACRYGLFATEQVTLHLPAADLAATMQRLRADPPRQLGGHRVVAVEDLLAGVGGLPPTDGLRWRLDGDRRVIVRPSGTESKLKFYLEVVVVVTGGDVRAARASAAKQLSVLGHAVRFLAGLPIEQREDLGAGR